MADYTGGVYFLEPNDYQSKKVLGKYFLQISELTPLTSFQPYFPEETSIGIDESIVTGIAFYYPTRAGVIDSFTFEDGQTLPAEALSSYNQKRMLSKAGKPSIAGSTWLKNIILVKLRLVPMEKIVRLNKLFANIVEGALKTLEYEDESGTVYKVRVWDVDFPRRMEPWLKHDINITLFVESRIYVP